MNAPHLNPQAMLKEFVLLRAKREEKMLALQEWQRPGVKFEDVFKPAWTKRRSSPWPRLHAEELKQLPKQARLISQITEQADQQLRHGLDAYGRVVAV